MRLKSQNLTSHLIASFLWFFFHFPIFFFSGFDQPKVSSESAISPSAATAQDTLQQLVISSKSNGANFLKSTLPALTNKLQRMVTSPIEEVHQPTINNSRPPLSDKEFRSFLDNVGELVNKTFLLDLRLDMCIVLL